MLGARAGLGVLAASFVIFALYRAVTSSFSVLILPLEAELQTNRASVTIVFTAHMLVYAATSPVSGLIVSRLNPYRTIMLGALLTGAGLSLMTAFHHIAGYVIAFGLLCGAGMALTGLPANFAILSSQFPKRVATAVGIATAGMGIGVLGIVPALQWSTNQIGWRDTFLVAGIAIALVMLCAVWVSRHATDDTASSAVPKSAEASRAQLGAILRMPVWYGLGVTNFILGLVLFGVTTHQVAMVQGAGWASLTAAATVGVVNLLRSLAGPCWGMALDRYRTATIFMLSTSLSLIGFGMLILLAALPEARDPLIAAFTLAFGVGAAGTLPANAVLTARLFTPAQRAISWGLTDATFAFGGAFGAWIVGCLFDISGNYVSSLILIGASLFSTNFIVRALNRKIDRAAKVEP